MDDKLRDQALAHEDDGDEGMRLPGWVGDIFVFLEYVFLAGLFLLVVLFVVSLLRAQHERLAYDRRQREDRLVRDMFQRESQGGLDAILKRWSEQRDADDNDHDARLKAM